VPSNQHLHHSGWLIPLSPVLTFGRERNARPIGWCGKVEGSLEEIEAPKKTAEPEIDSKAPDEGLARTLDEVIGMLQEKLVNEELKCSLGDLLRLLNVRKELTGAQPQTVTVRWVEECKETPSVE
jgi:hypothetical protein